MSDKKLFTSILLGISVIVGYNVFLIQRDKQLFEAYNQPFQQQVK